jgi:hypothetical protein
MSLSFLCALQSRSRKTRRSSASTMQRFRPALEPLEQRMLLTVFKTWDFQTEDSGNYERSEIAQDFEVRQGTDLEYYAMGDNDIGGGQTVGQIVTDSINGESNNKVLKMQDVANTIANTFATWADLSEYFPTGVHPTELYLSYDWKFDTSFCSTKGGKLPGLISLPRHVDVSYPLDEEGFNCYLLFKRAGTITTYHYDRTYPEGETNGGHWDGIKYNGDTDAYPYNPIYMNNGNWYNITQRIVLNTFTGGVANYDGINELWVDGRMIFQETTLRFDIDATPGKDIRQIDGLVLTHFYGGGEVQGWAPIRNTSASIDNVTVYLPSVGEDPTVGTRNLHNPWTVLTTPNAIDANHRTLVRDYDRATQGILTSSTWNDSNPAVLYEKCTDETYRIDAGAGNKVTYNVTAGVLAPGTYMMFYDGDQTDSKLLYEVEVDINVYPSGYDLSVPAHQFTVNSTGRYMFVRLSTDSVYQARGFKGTVSFAAAAPAAPTGLTATPYSTTQINLNWTDNGNETVFELDRSTNMSSWTQINITSNTGASTGARTYSDTGLTANTKYYYRIRSSLNGTNDSTNCPSAVPYASACTMLTVYSVAAEDGYVTTSAFDAGLIEAGDLGTNAQLKGILSFDTSALPDNATITSATLRLRQNSLMGNNNPFDWGGQCRVDIKGGTGFGGSYGLAYSDFSATADATNVVTGGTWNGMSKPAANGDWSTGTLTSGLSYINTNGKTQFRVYFSTGSNNDGTNDYLTFYAGDSTSGYKPELVITYATCDAPDDMLAITVSGTRTDLSWDDNSNNETDFRVDRATSPSFVIGTTTFTVGSNVTTYSDTGLTAGTTYYYRVRATINGNSSNATNVVQLQAGNQGPYGGSLNTFRSEPWPLAGVIQCENYDTWRSGDTGEAEAFHDTTTGNAGGLYRTGTGENVDIYYSSVIGNYITTVAGEWTEYTFNAASTGAYPILVRYAQPDLGAQIHVEIDGVNVSGTYNVLETDDPDHNPLHTPNWNTFQIHTICTTTIRKGTHVMRLSFDTNSSNGYVGRFDWIDPPAAGGEGGQGQQQGSHGGGHRRDMLVALLDSRSQDTWVGSSSSATLGLTSLVQAAGGDGIALGGIGSHFTKIASAHQRQTVAKPRTISATALDRLDLSALIEDKWDACDSLDLSCELSGNLGGAAHAAALESLLAG